jgi:hypothetical protein
MLHPELNLGLRSEKPAFYCLNYDMTIYEYVVT